MCQNEEARGYRRSLAPLSELKPDISLGIETYHYTGGIHPPAGISCGRIYFLESTTEGETVDRVDFLNKTFSVLLPYRDRGDVAAGAEDQAREDELCQAEGGGHQKGSKERDGSGCEDDVAAAVV
ncbi:hypothetical protein V500_10603 [Pseudogymnoascus sp. VKM F-4518 (FW-2643)]|nr:hypothetical protein V500_10603 [Pseudogymnoascus sp. VKM F-4518 (FW-2643)]